MTPCCIANAARTIVDVLRHVPTSRSRAFTHDSVRGRWSAALTAIATLAALVLTSESAQAQEFLDTAGRWKSLSLPSVQGGVTPRSMIAYNGHVVIGRSARSVIVSSDSGETWRESGSSLPAGLSTMWAMAYVDTATAPGHIIGIASTSTSPVQVRTVTSIDGGYTWRDGVRLPELDVLFTVQLDTMRLYGPPSIVFVPNASGGGRTGFIYSAAGLLASTDDGATWTRRGTPLAIRSLAMADELNGVAALGEHQPNTTLSSTAGGMFWTSDGGVTWTQSYTFPDGGFFQYITIHPFSRTSVRAFVPERFQNYLDWRLLRSDDGGRTWDVHRGRVARRPLYGLAVFRDTTDVHVISDGAILQHSGNGGELFYLLRDTTVTPWWQTPLDDIPGYVTKAPIAAYDNRYLYFTVANTAARWRMASVEPRSSVADESLSDDALHVHPHPVIGSSRVRLGRMWQDVEELHIVDALGSIRARLPVVDGTASIDARRLGAGRYVVIGRSSRGTVRRALVVLR